MTDADDLVEQDKQKARKAVQKSIRRYRSEGTARPPIDIPSIFEKVMWTFAILSVIFMGVAMPFTGPDKLIPGRAWLGLSLTGILLFGGLAILIRVIRSVFGDVDRALEQGFSRNR